MRRPRRARAIQALTTTALLAIAATLAACDSNGNPVATTGTTLLLSASSTQIGADGSAVITVTAVRGSIPAAGIEIQLSTTLGRIDPTVVTDARGVARALLEGTGRSGTAKVTAASGGATAVTLDIVIGLKVGTVTLSVSPSSVSRDVPTNVSLRALVRDDQGLALPGAGVVFTAEVGTLASSGALVTTSSNGLATDTLRVTAAEAALPVDGSIRVTAQVSGGGGSDDDIQEIVVQRPPIASFTYSVNAATRTITANDTSTGAPTEWAWDFDADDDIDSTSPNAVFTYALSGTYTVTLTVSNAFGDDDAVQQVIIP
jgi:hypothetical protein